MDRAKTDYNVAIRIDPKNALAYYKRAGLQFSALDFDGALEDLNQAIEIEPNPEFYVGRALLWEVKGKIDRAIEDYGFQAMGMKPDDAEYLTEAKDRLKLYGEKKAYREE